MQEDASAQPADGTFGSVRIDIVPGLGQWIRRAGEDVATGDVVLAKGVRFDARGAGAGRERGL